MAQDRFSRWLRYLCLADGGMVRQELDPVAANFEARAFGLEMRTRAEEPPESQGGFYANIGGTGCL